MPIVTVYLEEDVDFIGVSVFMGDEPDAADNPPKATRVERVKPDRMGVEYLKGVFESRLAAHIGKEIVALLKRKGEI